MMKHLTTTLLACIVSAASGAAERCDEALSALKTDTQGIGLHQNDGMAARDAVRENVVRLQRSAEILGAEGRDDACVSAVDQARAFVARMALPVAVRSDDLLGKLVVDPNGRKIGELDELVFDMTEAVAAYALIEFGGFLGFGEDLVPVPFSALALSDDGEHLVLEADLKRLELAPRYDQDNLNGMANRDWSRSVHDFYGQDPYWMNQGRRTRGVVHDDGLDARRDMERNATAAQALGERVPVSVESGDEETVRWRSDIQDQLGELVEQRAMIETIRDEVAALRASDRQAGRQEMMAMLQDLNREVRELGTLAARQQQLLTRPTQRGDSSSIAATDARPKDRAPEKEGNKPKESASGASSDSEPKIARPAEGASATTQGNASVPGTDRNEGVDTRPSASAHGDRRTPASASDDNANRDNPGSGKQGVVTGPSSDVLVPAPSEPGQLVETRDVGESDTGGRVEMPVGWGDNKAGTARAGEQETTGGRLSSRERAVRTLFSRLDVDGSGHLDRTETQSDSVIYRHFLALDANEDEGLDQREFRALVGMTPRFDAGGALLTLGEDDVPARTQ